MEMRFIIILQLFEQLAEQTIFFLSMKASSSGVNVKKEQIMNRLDMELKRKVKNHGQT